MVAAEKLGRRVQNNIRSEIERILKIGRHGAVIHAQQRSVRVGKVRHPAQIDYAQQRIGGRLDKNQLGQRSNLLLELLWSASILVAHGDAVAIDYFGKQAAGSTI